jgi:hypothetical protein
MKTNADFSYISLSISSSKKSMCIASVVAFLPPVGIASASNRPICGAAFYPKRIDKSDISFNFGIHKITVCVCPVISSFILERPESVKNPVVSG